MAPSDISKKMVQSAPETMEVSSITPILRVVALLLALALTSGCERVLELGLSAGMSTDMDAGDDTDEEDGGGDASDSDTDTSTEPIDTDDPDGSTDGSMYDGAT